MSAKKKELGYLEDQHSLIIMDTFKGQDNEEMKGVCAKNNCELTRSSLWILASINQQINSFRKIFRWTETTKEFLVVFSLFSWKHNFVWSFESIDLFFAKYTSHCHFSDYMYGSKGSNGVKKQKKGPYFRKINFGEKFRRWKISVGKNFRRLLISSVKNFHQLKLTKLFKNIVTFNRRNFNQ